jgi:hypothetical protein
MLHDSKGFDIRGILANKGEKDLGLEYGLLVYILVKTRTLCGQLLDQGTK